MSRRVALLVALIPLLLASAVPVYAECYDYPDSHMYDFGLDQGGGACVGNGGGCRECVRDAPPGGQASVCVNDWGDSFDIICYYFGVMNQLP